MATNISVPSWSPYGENGDDLFIERGNLVGGVLGGVAYGMFLVLWFICVHYQVSGKSMRQISWGLLAYVSALLIASTVYFGASTKWVQQMFIDFRNYHLDNTTTDPLMTGPLGFYENDYNTPMIVLGNAAYVVLNSLADGLVLYRCYLIWNFNWLVMFVPTLMFLGSTAMSIITVWNNSLPNAHFFGATSKAFATSWVILSMTLNIILTLLIVGRLLHARKKLVAVLGKQHARLYTSIAAMVVESAALYSGLSLLFIIFYEQLGVAINFVNIILPLLTQSMCIAPTLILVRVARGRAYSKDTAVATSTGISINRSTGQGSGMHGSATKVPMVTLNSKGSRTELEEEQSTGWGIQKHEESVSSYV